MAGVLKRNQVVLTMDQVSLVPRRAASFSSGQDLGAR